jgi:putative sigma-54 modulation protein
MSPPCGARPLCFVVSAGGVTINFYVRGIWPHSGGSMNTEIKAVHFNLRDDAREYLDRKIERIHNAENMIVDLLFTLTKDKDFSAETTVNFRWGVSIHVKEHDFELIPAIDKMIDKLEAKITKEKEKAKDIAKKEAASEKHKGSE